MSFSLLFVALSIPSVGFSGEVIYDSFSRSDGNALDNTENVSAVEWTKQLPSSGGASSVLGQKLCLATDDTVKNSVVLLGTEGDEYDVPRFNLSMDIELDTTSYNDWFSIYYHVQDAATVSPLAASYNLQIRHDGTITLYDRDGDGKLASASVEINPGIVYNLEITSNEGHHIIHWNEEDEAIIEVIDSTPWEGGSIRLWAKQYSSFSGETTSTLIDNFKLLRPIELSVSLDESIREITNETYASGISFHNEPWRNTMASESGREFIAEHGLGMLRWPHGTKSQHYFWNQPDNSYTGFSTFPGWSMTTSEFFGYSETLQTEPVLQVNTYQYPAYSGTTFREVNQRVQVDWNEDGVYRILTEVVKKDGTTINPLEESAAYAAGWVESVSNTKGPGYVSWWEIGNEDWATLTGADYGKIVNEFAARMKAADTSNSIKLLATAFSGSWENGALKHTGPEWMEGLIGALTVENRTRIDAVSEHTYFSGLLPGGTENDGTLEQQIANLLAQTSALNHTMDLQKVISDNNLPWEIWATEFNVLQRDSDDVNSETGKPNLVLLQNVGHGLVIADLVGRMLEIGVSRLFFHSLNGNPFFAMANYQHYGTAEDPWPTVPGMVFSRFANGFGDRMLDVQIEHNPEVLEGTFLDNVHQMQFENIPQITRQYASLSAFAAMQRAGKEVNLVLINRDLVNELWVSSDILGGDYMESGDISVSQLGGNVALDAHNMEFKDTVQWDSFTVAPGNLEDLVLPPHSITFYKIPFSYPVHDTFTRPDSPELGVTEDASEVPWTKLLQSSMKMATVRNGSLDFTTTSSVKNAVSVLGGTGTGDRYNWSDITLKMDVMFDSNQYEDWFGVYYRAQDVASTSPLADGYNLQIRHDGTVKLFDRGGDGVLGSASVSLVSGTSYSLKIVSNNGRQTVYWDGVAIIDVNDPTPWRKGGIKLWAFQEATTTSVDNLDVACLHEPEIQ